MVSVVFLYSLHITSCSPHWWDASKVTRCSSSLEWRPHVPPVKMTTGFGCDAVASDGGEVAALGAPCGAPSADEVCDFNHTCHRRPTELMAFAPKLWSTRSTVRGGGVGGVGRSDSLYQHMVVEDWEHAAEVRDTKTCGLMAVQGITNILLVGDSRVRMLFDDFVRFLNNSYYGAPKNIDEVLAEGIPPECVGHSFRYQHPDLCTTYRRFTTPYSVCNGTVHIGYSPCWKVTMDCWKMVANFSPKNVGLMFVSVGIHDALYSPANVLEDGVSRFMGTIARRNAAARAIRSTRRRRASEARKEQNKSLGRRAEETTASVNPSLTRVVFMDGQPLCTRGPNKNWDAARLRRARVALAAYNSWLVTASQSTCEEWGVIAASKLLQGRCDLSGDGIHFGKQTASAILTALLDGLDPDKFCGRSPANQRTAAMGAPGRMLSSSMSSHCTPEQAKLLPNFESYGHAVQEAAGGPRGGGGAYLRDGPTTLKAARSWTLSSLHTLLLIAVLVVGVFGVLCRRLYHR